MLDGRRSVDRPFDAAEFIELMSQGAFDGRLTDSFISLSYEQPDQAARLLLKQLNEKREP
jgi:hypothetical protein